jgi:hypothetical protein
MQSQEQPQVTLFRAIVLAGAIAFLMTSAAFPLTAQNSSPQKSVPSNARQAATMPQFAAKLAHGASRVSRPVTPRASYKRPANAFAPAKRNWMGGENELYDNDPINGTPTPGPLTPVLLSAIRSPFLTAPATPAA